MCNSTTAIEMIFIKKYMRNYQCRHLDFSLEDNKKTATLDWLNSSLFDHRNPLMVQQLFDYKLDL
jgi:hypothetical protein